MYSEALWLHWICIGIVVAFVLLGSVVFTAPSSNATISFIVVVGIMFCGGHLNGVATHMGGIGGNIVYAIYFCIPHLEWYYVKDIVVQNWGLIPGAAVVGATVYGLLYSAFLSGRGLAGFSQKEPDFMNRLVLTVVFVCCVTLATELAPMFDALQERTGATGSPLRALLGDQPAYVCQSILYHGGRLFSQGLLPDDF